MEIVSKFIEEMRLGQEYCSIFDEVKVSRFLLVSNLIRGKKRRTYFQRMRKEFRQINLPKLPQILTPTEYREYQVIRRSGYILYMFFIVLQRAYGMVLTFTKAQNGQ
jgi:hypothetical protein